MKENFNIERTDVRKLKTEDKTVLFIGGWSLALLDESAVFILEINGEQTPFELKKVERKDVSKRKNIDETYIGFELSTSVQKDVENVRFYVKKDTIIENYLSLNASDLSKQKKEEFFYSIDSINKIEKKDQIELQVLGWALYDKEFVADVSVWDGINVIDCNLQRLKRMDLVQAHYAYGQGKYAGFVLNFIMDPNKKYSLKFQVQGHEKIVPLKLNKGLVYNTKSFLKKLNKDNLLEMNDFIREFGMKEFLHTYSSNQKDTQYHQWFLKQRIKKSEIEKQRQSSFSYQPKISIIVATFNTSEEFLDDMIGSVLKQTYSNWQLCIADGSDTNFVIDYLEQRYSNESRVVWKKLEKNYGISGNMNEALELSNGDYVGLYDHDDFLEADCLFEVVKSLQEFQYDIVYTDEDKFDNDTKFFIDPNFKPDYNVDLFRSHNYITHFFCVNKRIIDEVGGMRPEYDGSQDYDFMFRCIEKANGIYHIPRILYHWRIHPLSTAGNPESKMYCYEAGQKAIQAHYDRCGVHAKVEMMPKPYYGLYHTSYSTAGNPMVSVIIPNMNHKDILKTCIDSLYEKNTYKNFEVIIIENNSNQQEIFDYYNELEAQHENVHVVYWKGIFNYSAINNFGVKYAKGDYYLFLNNDTEVIEPNAIEEMLGCCMRPEVGIVGAKLLYEDDTVQHAGVVVGFNNYAGHVFTEIDKDDLGYMMRPIINCDYSAVTAACMMVKKSVFEQVQGFDEQFEVACNDVDFCLRVREIGKLVVYNAFALWHHYESKSRGYENSIGKIQRFDNEMSKFYKRWKKFIDQGDPYYNKNFKIEYGPFKYTN